MKKTATGKNHAHTNSQMEQRLLNAISTIFRSERERSEAVGVLERFVGPSFAATVVELATSERTNCRSCGLDFAEDELGASGACAECGDSEAQERMENA